MTHTQTVPPRLKVGDIAFIASSLGATFFSIQNVHLDPAGNITALTVTEGGPPVDVKRFTAVFPNTLNARE